MNRLHKILLMLAALAALSGCATAWVVDSEVSAHSTLGDFQPGTTFRFERLPSQEASPSDRDRQARLEAMATPALEAVGLRRDDTRPRYSVQLGAQVTRILSPWADPWGPYGAWGPWGPGWGWGPGWYGAGMQGQPWFVREVSLVMRRLPGNEIVYETRARHDGPYNRSNDVLPVMFQAALKGFPAPPSGTRRVDIPLGGPPPATPAPAARPAPEPAAAPVQVSPVRP